MRILALCLIISYGVLLALPEASGAPTSCDAKKNDDLIYKKTEEEKSKYQSKSVSEERDVESEDNVCSNGLSSGRREISTTTEMTAEEMEKSRKATEVKTANGSEKAEESAKKKTLVSANSKQTVVVYYLVSYKKLPKLKENECKIAYFKRVFPKEKDSKVLYHKIFKVYEGEEPLQYVERIEYIFDKVYPELDPRLDVRYVDFFDHYYTQRYFRKIGECDEHYYKRVLKRFDCETFDHYRKRMQCLEASLDEEDFEHITFVDTELGFTVGKRKKPVTSVSSPKSSGIKYGNFKNEKKKTRKQARKLDATEEVEQEKSNKGSSVKAQRKLHTTNEVIEKEEEIKMFSYKVAYTRLPKRKIGQCDADYYREFFGKYDPKITSDQRNEMYLRLLIQYKDENFKEYVQRIDYLFDKVYPELDVRTNKIFVSMLEHYYREKYLKSEKESEDAWFARVLKKLPNESAEQYKGRLYCIETVFLDAADWSRVVIDANSSVGYTLKPIAGKAPPKDKKKKKKDCGCA
ncbi:uncharacterized protein LOC129001601 [Macrosteles quadrilineatus]|uniref:uncharacterized protein LOC129001601 n=1 Tax=Macrosteles quadrilineatus TaxID=74068 RepID=UPI0023E2B95C|nr:uncharacterized protein LOC129001601 [Macrosteles quadrilineatus]